MKTSIQTKKAVLLSLRIGLGSALAIFIADFFQLQSSVAAGTITLLTLLTTRIQTVRLIINRFLTFIGTILICLLVLHFVKNYLVAFGIILFFIVAMCEFANVQNTLSVNALIATHLAITHNFNWNMILNEFYLLIIGVMIAYILNMFQNYKDMEQDLAAKRAETEKIFQNLLNSLVIYIEEQPESSTIWKEMRTMESRMFSYVNDAKHYKENRYRDKKVFYVEYFQMREQQLSILYALHEKLRQIRTMPKQSRIIAQFIKELANSVTLKDDLNMHNIMLDEIFSYMKQQPLPLTREEFESRAILYHILYDLESYLKYQNDFIHSLNEDLKLEYSLAN